MVVDGEVRRRRNNLEEQNRASSSLLYLSGLAIGPCVATRALENGDTQGLISEHGFFNVCAAQTSPSSRRSKPFACPITLELDLSWRHSSIVRRPPVYPILQPGSVAMATTAASPAQLNISDDEETFLNQVQQYYLQRGCVRREPS